MAETVEVRGQRLKVYDVSKLPFPKNIQAGMVASRLDRHQKEGKLRKFEEDIAELIALCIDEPIQPETIRDLNMAEMGKIIEIALQSMDVEIT